MDTPILDALTEDSLPEVAAALRAAQDRIIQRWSEAVARHLPHADRLTLEGLQNSIPDLLCEMATALESDQREPAQRFFADAPAHGDTRFHQQFNIGEMVGEYYLLRRTILEELSGELDRPLNANECIAVNAGIDIALRQAVVAFAKHQSSQITNEAETMAKYLSFLSHDLRGGLNGSILMIEVLRRELAGEAKFATSLEDLDIMRRQMLETVATMDRFLHAERLRRGKMPVNIGEVKTVGLLEQVARTIRNQVYDKKIAIDIKADSAPQTIRTDADVVAIILQNLISNAVKYGKGNPVRVEAREGHAGDTRISVIDQGPGIAPEKLTTLFAAFQRGDTHGQRGVGLGLTIARQAAELLGAKLTVESTVGNGSSFHLDLPQN